MIKVKTKKTVCYNNTIINEGGIKHGRKNIYFVNDEAELKQVLEFIDKTDYGINIDKTREDVYAVVTSYSLPI